MTWIHSSRFAKKVKNAGGVERITPEVPDNFCPTCHKPIDNDSAPQDWTLLPAGVKFDPNDKEILDHLAAKVGRRGKPHALIDEFIPTLEDDEGICSKHPEKLPGVKNDGSSSHFFHRPSNAYTKGTRKRRKVLTDDDDEMRWHKTGKTRPVMESGELFGWKKIMVLYTNFKKKSGKPKKTNWVIHQYHLGVQEDEREGELVMSKVFYQTQPRGSAREPCEANEANEPADAIEAIEEASNEFVAEVNSNDVIETRDLSAEYYEYGMADGNSTMAAASGGGGCGGTEVLRPMPTRAAPYELAELCPSTSVQGESFFGASSSSGIGRCSSAMSQPMSKTAAGQKEIEDLVCDESLQNAAQVFAELSSQEIRAFVQCAGISCEEDLPDNWDNFNFSLGSGGEVTSQELENWLKSDSQEL